MIDQKFLQKLRILSFIEGVSTLVLFFIAMPLKYLGGIPIAVTIVGSVHGLLFTLLAIMFLIAINQVPISLKLAITGIVAAVFPFGPFIFDRWLVKVGEEDTQSPIAVETEKSESFSA